MNPRLLKYILHTLLIKILFKKCLFKRKKSCLKALNIFKSKIFNCLYLLGEVQNERKLFSNQFQYSIQYNLNIYLLLLIGVNVTTKVVLVYKLY